MLKIIGLAAILLTGCAANNIAVIQETPPKQHAVKRIHTHKVKQIYDINNEIPRNLYVFQPEYLEINVGDTIFFDGTVRGHTVHSISGMIPKEAEKIAIMPRQNANVTFTVPGVYGIRCKNTIGMAW